MDRTVHPIPSRLWVISLAETLSGRIKFHVDAWPSHERAGLGDQVQRAIDSVGANITEGYVRVHVRERLNFFSMAQGSLEETLYHLRKARDRNLITRLEAFTLSGLTIRLSKGLQKLGDVQTERTAANQSGR